MHDAYLISIVYPKYMYIIYYQANICGSRINMTWKNIIIEYY